MYMETTNLGISTLKIEAAGTYNVSNTTHIHTM
jgi:hypothetical protein